MIRGEAAAGWEGGSDDSSDFDGSSSSFPIGDEDKGRERRDGEISS